MRNLTQQQLYNEDGNMFYILPFNSDSNTNDDLFMKTISLLTHAEFYCIIQNDEMTVDYTHNRIEIEYLYDGDKELYIFIIYLELVRLVDENDKEIHLLLIGHFEQQIHALFNIIIREKLLFEWEKQLNLKNFYNIDLR
jgi:hypothetical protein